MVVTGREAILSVQPLLVELASRSGQLGDADYVDYFLMQPYTGGKIPHLFLLLSSPVDGVAKLSSMAIVGAVLIHEYQVAGIPLKIFVTDDHAGERNVLAAEAVRSAVALRVVNQLVERGAHLIVLSLRDAVFTGESIMRRHAGAGGMWAVVERTLTRRLPLAESFDTTLARLGAHTRRNLRYYRRRVEEQMGCSFVANPAMGEEEFVALNRLCSYPTPDFVSRWRYRTARTLRGGIFAGIRGSDGAWLSMVGGRRYGRTTSIDWQMNQTRFSGYSLSTVMRSYLIEQEIAAGAQTLLFEGGTPHSMQLSFPPDRVCDLLVSIDAFAGRLLRRYAARVLPKGNFVARALASPDLAWRPW